MRQLAVGEHGHNPHARRLALRQQAAQRECDV